MGTSKDILNDEIWKLKEKVKRLQKQNKNYKKAYGLFMDYFDYIPDEDKAEVSEQLEKVGL